MCWFITVAVPTRSRHLLEQLRLDQGVLHVTYLDETPTVKLFGPDHICAVITSRDCSCELVASSPMDPKLVLEQHEARLRKRGLSESKVRQALEAKAYALTKPHPSDEARAHFGRAVSALARGDSRMGLYSHFYRGNIRTEDVPRPGSTSVSLRSLEAGGFPPDMLVSVHAEGDGY